VFGIEEQGQGQNRKKGFTMAENAQTQDKTGDSELLTEISGLFHSLFSDMLNMLSARFPHSKGDGSSNEKEYLAMRAKVLRSGNDKLRQIPKILCEYDFERNTVKSTVNVGTPVRRP
jgi:hypothetical protein